MDILQTIICNAKGNPWNKTQRLDEENSGICLVVMFPSRIRVMKISQIAYFLYFLLMTAKKVVTIWRNCLMHQKDLIQSFQIMALKLLFVRQ